MALTDAEKTDIRRHCGFPLFGGQPVQAFGHRYYSWYGTLEFRMNNMQATEETVVRSYLTTITQLETDIAGARCNLDTDQAAAWKHNKNEVRDRTRLYQHWCRKLCAFFGVPPGPGLANAGTLTLVV